AECSNTATTLGTNQSLLGSLTWDTSLLNSGIYTLRLSCSDVSSTTNLLELTAQTAINNALTWHSGTITNSETWSNGTIHAVYGLLTLATGATVTVEAGTLIKVSDGGSFLVQGALDAQGTVDDPIIITSLADDSEGGDSNLDGNDSVPLPGDWTGLAAEGGTLLINEYTDIRYTQTTHGGTLSADEVWLGNMLHVLHSNLTINGSATLTINPGAIIKFGHNCGITIDQYCSLTAIGLPGQPIIFTSVRDDTAGGDSNDDGEETSPAAGDWGTIHANGGAIEMAHSELRYGAGTANGSYVWGAGALRTSAGAVLNMNACRIIDSLYEGIHATGGGTIGITNSIIMNCERAINADGAIVRLVNCTLYGNYIGLWPHGGTIDTYNTIIAYSLTTGVCAGVRDVEFCNVWSPYGINGAYTPGANGNISTNPAFKNITNGNFRLNYLSPCIDAADTTKAPATDCMNAPRVNDPRTLVKHGVANTNGIYADMGAYEFTDNAESDVDLIVVYATGPTSAEANGTAQVIWMVRNVGAESASGSWHDRISLVNGNGLNSVTTVVATVYHPLPITLGPGKEVCFTNTVSVPGVTDGNYSWQVEANSATEIYEGKNRTNNITRSTAVSSVSVPKLNIGSTVTCRFDQDAQSRWFAVPTDAGSGLLIRALKGTNTCLPELYLGAGYVPSRQTCDACFLDTSATGAALQVQSTIEGACYFMLYNASLTKGAAFTVSAALAEIELTSVTPDEVGNGAEVTLIYGGTLLNADMTCRLAGPNLTVFTANIVAQNSDENLRATFDLSAATPGYYDASVIHDDITNTIADAIQVVAGALEDVSYSLILPSAIRAGREAEILVQFVNNGNTDVDLSRLRIALDHAVVVDSRYEETTETNSYYVLLSDSTGTSLAPGENGTARLRIKADTTSSDVSINVYSSEMDSELDWGSMKNGFRPFFVPSAAWDICYARFTNEVGTSLRDYLQMIGRYKSYLVSVGVTELEEADIFQYAMMYAGAVADVTPNYICGPFGYGGPNTLEGRLYVQTNNDVIIGNSQANFYFSRTKTGTYNPQTGVFSTLTQTNEAWKLRHKDGSVVTFASDGKPETIEYPWGNALTFQHSGDRLVTISNLLGNYKQYVYNGSGRIIRIDHDSGRSTYLTYDAAQEHMLVLSNEQGSVQYTYYTNSSSPAQRHAIKTMTFPDQTHQYYFYNTAGRISRIEKDNGLEAQKFAYGPYGQVALSNAVGNTANWANNDRSQLASYKNEAGNLALYEYDPATFQPSRINQAGLVTRCQYDEKGNLLNQEEPDGGLSSCAFNRSNSTLTAYSDLNGNTYRWRCNAAGLYTNAVCPDGTKTDYRSDEFGRATQMIDRCGTVFTTRYAANNKVAGCDASDGSAKGYGYNAYHDLVAATNEHGTTAIQVDGAGRITRITYPHGRWIAYQYNTMGQLDRISYDDGYEVDYLFNARGYLSAVTNSNGLSLSYTYDNAGRIIRINKGTARTEYDYQSGRLASIYNYAANDAILSSFVYGYNAQDNVTSMQTHLGSWAYAYDAGGRLKSAVFTSSDAGVVSNQSVSFSYDAAGNRTALVRNGVTNTYQVDNMNRYRSAGDATMTYDARGNLIYLTEGTNVWAFTYNAWNKLLSAQGPEGAWTNQYDALDNLIAREQNGVRTEYVMDAAFSLCLGAAYSETAQTNHFVFADGLLAQTEGATHRYAMHDAAGSVSEVMAPDGSILNRYGYLPFGEMMLKAETVSNPFTFIGQWGVEKRGGEWYRMNNRLYNAVAGRFCAEDPLAIIHPNAYIYANNNPMAYVDPLGLAASKGNGPLVYMTTAEARAYLDGNCAIRQKVAHALKGTLPSGKPGETALTALITALAANSPAPTVLGTIESVTEAAPVTGLGLVSFYTLKKDRAFFEAINDGRIRILDSAPQQQKAVTPMNFPDPQTAAQKKAAFDKAGEDLQWLIDHGMADSVSEENVIKHNLTKPSVGDPNEIVGPEGAGTKRWVSVNATMPYVIYFENLTNATALVQWLTVTNVLDDQLDISTFALGGFGIGSNRYSVPQGLQVFTTNVDMREEYGVDVRFEATVDTDTRVITWALSALDTNTGLLVEDPWLGFLPPNTNPPSGQGFVSYSVNPLTNAVTGGAIQAQAGIQFEYNDIIMTPRITNSIDNTAPVSDIPRLGRRVPRVFGVTWTGSDVGSGIAQYDVYVSANSNAFTLWRRTNAVSGTYTGLPRTNYAFLVRAMDHVGNMESKYTADARTTVGGALKNDLDGDGKSDIGCYDASLGAWYAYKSHAGFWSAVFGYAGTTPISGDFDGDNLCDYGVYYAPNGQWNIMRSTAGPWENRFGYSGTLPITGDFDGDGLCDFGCYDANAGAWYIYKSTEGFWTNNFGFEGTLPITGDFDGDGRCDFGCYYPPDGGWYIYKSTEGYWQNHFGFTGTLPITGDFDGDGCCDFGCYYPLDGGWYIYKSTEGYWQNHFGFTGTLPVTGDYDGDVIDDFGCYHPPSGGWFIYKSTEGFWTNNFGYEGTVPMQ
ncbi:MAG: choice-of-anchor Q domain-containing protein, partial [Kiritimatiellae bacterium]|nr:choice-of-anchor Q domain-containing protein [Kiritimatiellia bacterium]